METSNNVDGIIKRAKEQAIGQAPELAPMHINKHSWKMQRVLHDAYLFEEEPSQFWQPTFQALTAALVKVMI